MKKISIIIPVYNVEKYIKKCLESVINQTYKNLEIILVDDGSIDCSGNICDEYAKKDSRIKVVHKINGGLSEARNTGIEHATGEYIGFIDSDDYIEKDMYEILYKNIKKENADISMCGIIDCYGKIIENKDYENKYLVLNSEQAIKIVFEAKMNSVYAVNKLYRSNLFKTIKYPVGKFAEDAMVIVELLMQCEKVVLTTEKKYYYIHRENSITTNKFSIKNYDVIEAYKKNKKIIEEKFPSLIKTADMRICWANFFVLDKMLIANIKSDKQIVKYLKSNFLFIIFNNIFTISRKISMCALMLNVNLYKVLLLKFQNKNRKLFL